MGMIAPGWGADSLQESGALPWGRGLRRLRLLRNWGKSGEILVDERRRRVRRMADRELGEYIARKTGEAPAQIVFRQKFRRAIRHECEVAIEVDTLPSSDGEVFTHERGKRYRGRLLDLSGRRSAIHKGRTADGGRVPNACEDAGWLDDSDDGGGAALEV